jgi:PAS domain S-box-containing protein
MEEKEQQELIQEKKYRKVKEELESIKKYVDELTFFLPLPFCTINPLDLVLGVNNAFQELSGYKEMEIVGNEIDFIFLEKNKIQDFKKDILGERKIFNREFNLVKKDKSLIPVNISALARTDDNGNFLGYFLTISDITEIKEFQKKLEEKVSEKTEALENKTKELNDSRKAVLNVLEDTEDSRRKAEEEKDKTQAIISNFTDGLLVFDKKNVLNFINPRAQKIFDLKTDEIINKKLNDLKENQEMKNLVEILLQSPDFDLINESDSSNFRKEIKNNKGLTIEVTTIPIFNEGKKTTVLAVLHDITRERMIEAMKSEFVSIAAHQLRTPLSAIKWTMRMFLDGDLGKLNEGQFKLAEKAYLSNDRMVNLVNDLLNVSRIEEGRYLYKPSQISFNEIINPILETYKEEIKRRGIDFEINNIDKKLPLVAVDVEKITLVIQNFLDNAMKYTQAKGKIIFSTTFNNKEIEVSVKDNGVGIPKDQHERIFSKFFRAANVVRMETEGSGLGLFICKNIIGAHGGKIWFESKEKEGSLFSFTLPIIDTDKKFEEFLKKL